MHILTGETARRGTWVATQAPSPREVAMALWIFIAMFGAISFWYVRTRRARKARAS